MSIVNGFLTSIRKQAGQRFRLSDLNALKAAVRAAQVISVVSPLKINTTEGGAQISIKRGVGLTTVELPFEVVMGPGKDGKTPSILVYRNGGTFTNHDGKQLKIKEENELGCVEKAHSLEGAGRVAVCLSWAYKIEEGDEPEAMDLEIIKIEKEDDCKELVTPISAKDGQGKSRIVLATIEKKENGNIDFVQLVFSSLSAVWSYDFDAVEEKVKVGLSAIAVPGSVAFNSPRTA